MIIKWIQEYWFIIKIVVQVSLIAIGYYYILKFMKGTRGAGILKGLGVLIVMFIALAFLAQSDFFDFNVIRRLMESFFTVLMFGLVVIFQPELRRVLIRLGENPILGLGSKSRRDTINHIIHACQNLSNAKIGALVAIQRSVGLGTYIEGGVRLDAKLSAKLLTTIFKPGTPLHDGAVIIDGDTIVAAGCLFPLTENPEIDNLMYGTRHRAGIGLSEESDVFVIVISEETSDVSVCIHGEIERGIDFDKLRTMLEEHCFKEEHIRDSGITNEESKSR
ncbi:diadenylate cyclase CdaA [Planctomycetota bacterium]